MWCRRRHFSHSFRYCTKCLKQLLGALACPVERNFYRKCHSLDYRKLKRQLERSDASPLLIIDKHTKLHSSGVWNRSCPVLYHFQRKLLWFLCFIYFLLVCFVLLSCPFPSQNWSKWSPWSSPYNFQALLHCCQEASERSLFSSNSKGRLKDNAEEAPHCYTRAVGAITDISPRCQTFRGQPARSRNATQEGKAFSSSQALPRLCARSCKAAQRQDERC